MAITTETSTSKALPPRWADLTGRILMAGDALFTLGALVEGVQRVLDSDDAHLLTEAWRTLAYIVFAGLWFIIAVAPRRQWGIWEMLLIHKIAITAFAMANAGVPDSTRHIAADSILVVTTVIAYVLCRGWLAWRRTPPALA